MDIDLIFKAAGLCVPDRKVGDKEAMKANCARYIDTMCGGGDWPTYQELTAAIHAASLGYTQLLYTMSKRLPKPTHVIACEEIIDLETP